MGKHVQTNKNYTKKYICIYKKPPKFHESIPLGKQSYLTSFSQYILVNEKSKNI
jgi:hypothetical protein